ncbi:CerR family C-terminal domain-containing protein [Mesorhizobium xinjiangense]|uniref:CerR family C-terminal domain-containing protein n=1 Tax=Mesorhizobium xinjiangense TaxID=2678685 RepID=UPI0012EE5773|nr:CerR family C-terminal domain-containing protein [Mesorhizobium xinjiangense]
MKSNEPTNRPASAPSAEQTRKALIGAALKLFGGKGFDGTSTRELAAAAGANIGSIAYHFGGKEGLHMAAADHIVETVQTMARQALGDFDAPRAAPPDAETAREQLFQVLERMIHFVVARPESGEIVQFLLRELAHPSAALDRIYAGVFEPVHKRLCTLWELATGEAAESEETRLIMFTLIGQVVYFRIGREAVRRRMGWCDLGTMEAERIAAIAKANLAAILAVREELAK